MSEKERMEAGLLYKSGDEGIMKDQLPIQDKLYEFNQLKPSDIEKKEAYMKEVFAECGEGCYIELPFHANFGGAHVHFGNWIYANSDLTMVDDGHIYVGDHVMFGPGVTVSSAGHPVEPSLRLEGYQFNRDVHIEENVWIGAGVIILPGVTIGKDSVIGAGAVVTKDIPSGVVAVGNPARILREIGEHDREFYYKTDRIDWENLKQE